MKDFDYRKYLTEGYLFKETNSNLDLNDDSPEMMDRVLKAPIEDGIYWGENADWFGWSALAEHFGIPSQNCDGAADEIQDGIQNGSYKKYKTLDEWFRDLFKDPEYWDSTIPGVDDIFDDEDY